MHQFLRKIPNKLSEYNTELPLHPLNKLTFDTRTITVLRVTENLVLPPAWKERHGASRAVLAQVMVGQRADLEEESRLRRINLCAINVTTQFRGGKDSLYRVSYRGGGGGGTGISPPPRI